MFAVDVRHLDGLLVLDDGVVEVLVVRDCWMRAGVVSFSMTISRSI